MSKLTPKKDITKDSIIKNKFINIYFTGLFAIFFDQQHSRAMIGILDEKQHQTQFLVNGQHLKINDKNFIDSQKRWQVKLYLQSQKPLSISRGGTFENEDAFDYFVDIEKLEGCGNKETLPLNHEFFKGRFYLNAGEFKTYKRAFYGAVVDFVRQDSRMPLSTWRPRPIAESLKITIPLLNVKNAQLHLGNEFDSHTVTLDINKNVDIRIDNECNTQALSNDNDFIKFYKLMVDNGTPAVPVPVKDCSVSLLQPLLSDLKLPNAAHTEVLTSDKPIGNISVPPSPSLEAMCGGVLFGNTKSF